MLSRIDNLYRLGKVLVSWFDEFIMGWPMVLGQELQSAMEDKVRCSASSK